MFVEIVEEFHSLENNKNSSSKKYNSQLPRLSSPGAQHFVSPFTKSPIITTSKGINTASDVVNQKSIINNKKIKRQYDEIYSNSNLSKHVSKTSYRKLSCIYGEEDDSDRHIIMKRKPTNLSSLYSKFEKRKYPSQFRFSNIPLDIAREVENRTDKMIKLSEEELNKLKHIYRKGVTTEKIKNISCENNRKDERFDLFKKKRPVKNFLFKKQGLEENVYDVIEKDFKPVLDLAGRQIKLNQEAMERELILEFAKDFKIVEPHHFAKEFRTCEDIIEFEKKEEIKRQNNKNYKRLSIVYENMNTEDKVKKYDLYEKTKRCILTAAIQFPKLGINLEEFFSKKLISSKPLQSPESEYFFNYIKIGDEDNVIKLLHINRYLVYEFDYVS